MRLFILTSSILDSPELDKANPATQKRVKVLRVLSLIVALVAGIIFVPDGLLIQHDIVSAVMSLVLCLVMATIYVVLGKRPGYLMVFSHIVCGLIFVNILVGRIEPTSDAGSTIGFMVVVLFAYLLLGRKGGIIWGIATTISAFSLVALYHLHITSNAYSASTLEQVAVTLCVFTVLLYAYEGINLAYEKLLLKREQSLARELTQNQALTKELAAEKKSVERKVVERTEELSEAQAKLVSTIEGLSLGLIMVDSQNQIAVKNEAAGRVLGYDQRAWGLADLARDLGGAMDLVDTFEEVRKTHRPIGSTEVNFGPKVLRVSVNPVFEGNEVIGVVVSLEDITEAKVLERSKDEFFSIASHELRTPLTAIKGNASMMLSYYADALKDPGLHEMVEDVHTSSVRLIEIVNDFLDMSRIEQGKIQFKLGAFSLDKIIEQITYEMGAVTKQKGLYLRVGDSIKNLDSLPQVYADPDRTKQILYNLIGNGLKFTEKGGVTLAAVRKGKFLRVSVTDTGRGVSIDGQKLLFHKFQQAGPSLLTRDTTRGTGLGLYISKLLVEEMGGQINLEESVPGKGTTFTFTLPLYTKSKAATPTSTATVALAPAPQISPIKPPTPPAVDGTPAKRILIFEDDPYVQRFYRRLFAFENFVIELAGDGSGALARAKHFKPDLILLDIMMPKTNGLEVLANLKDDAATRQVPVLILTNFSEAESIEKAKQLGAAGYFIKADFTPEQMLAEVKKNV